MVEDFSETVNIYVSTHPGTPLEHIFYKIILDAKSSSIHLKGGEKDTIVLDGDRGSIELNNRSGKQVSFIDGGDTDRCSFHLGANAIPGYMAIRGKLDTPSIVLDGDKGSIELKNPLGNQVFFLDSFDGTQTALYLGASGIPGFLFIRGNSDDPSITLDGIQGDIILKNADCAEDFDISGSEQVEPGTVMIIEGEGALRKCTDEYDKRVAGVVSGAGDCKPGLVLDKRITKDNRKPVALMGKVFCKTEAMRASIEVGDLLTTSSIHGYAMKANDPVRAFGAVIGKALRPLKSGKGLIPILVTLQ